MQAQVLSPPNREANVVVLSVFWRFDYPWAHKNLVPPLLVYACQRRYRGRSEPCRSALDL